MAGSRDKRAGASETTVSPSTFSVQNKMFGMAARPRAEGKVQKPKNPTKHPLSSQAANKGSTTPLVGRVSTSGFGSDVISRRQLESLVNQDRPVAGMRRCPMGFVHCSEGLQTSVCYQATEVQRSCGFHSDRGGRARLAGRNNFAVGERRHQSCPSRGSTQQVLLLILPYSKERGLISSSHIRSPSVEQASLEIHIHNVDTQSVLSFYPLWFISIDLPDAYFHISIHHLHRKFLRFAYQGTAYKYAVVPFGLSLAQRVLPNV